MAAIYPLIPHPAPRSAAVCGIEVEIDRRPSGSLALRYVVTGAIDAIAWPAPAAPSRSDGLWRRTCFEMFAREEGAAAYRELNFAPSPQWAAYRFDDYRAGMREAAVEAPGIETGRDGERFEIDVRVALDLPEAATWLIGLSAVIEEKDGGKSWWALAFPPGEPDFHHQDCFALRLPPTARR
jgi:hypothetical protein